MNTSNHSTLNFQPSTRCRTGKVARLPKPTRDKINLMIQDGIPYSDIILILGSDVLGITERNLSNWKSGGYQDWLRQRERLASLKARQDLLLDTIARQDMGDLCRLALELAALNLCDLLAQGNHSSLDQLLPAAARIAETALTWQRQEARQQSRQINSHHSFAPMSFEEFARDCGLLP